MEHLAILESQDIKVLAESQDILEVVIPVLERVVILVTADIVDMQRFFLFLEMVVMEISQFLPILLFPETCIIII